MLRTWLCATAFLLAVIGPARAQSPDTAGVRYDPQIQLHGATLQLNGAGERYKAIFKVYAAGLYLTQKAATPEAVFRAAGPRRMHIVMLREIDANELGKLFTRGIEQNASREDFVKSIPGTIRLGEIFAAKKKLAAGESFQVDWIPGTGTQILVNGQPMGEPIKEPEFYNALLKIWLGAHPADAALKEALLGKARPSASAHEG
ncbi:chalcone isomerase family protein [Caldimonas thermodepolymerans]|uniref:chalcone isomerase family protein n=1 Tax=Caldimonas thermodepolymerans TaxID=215580 RepID=UPI0022368EFF|nr:chalcone isomerase family protein [Caldimonas thermodepolymerans]UZG43963.1 chalcone isomerase family protein [Caldimonas thermodepolymerans]